MSVHDCHPTDVWSDWGGDGERSSWRHPRTLLKASAIHNDLAARDREHNQHRRRSRSDGCIGTDAAGVAVSFLVGTHYRVCNRP